jgi:hypothetical protein
LVSESSKYYEGDGDCKKESHLRQREKVVTHNGVEVESYVPEEIGSRLERGNIRRAGAGSSRSIACLQAKLAF